MVARNHIVTMKPFDEKLARKKTAPLDMTPAQFRKLNVKEKMKVGIHKQPGSKILFVTNAKGEQIKLDAYYHLWKRRVLTILKRALHNTDVANKKTAIQRWLSDFKNKSNEEIAEFLRVELQNKKSPLLTHNWAIVGLFKNPDSYTAVENLIDEWDKINASTHTHKLSEKTGLTIQKNMRRG